MLTDFPNDEFNHTPIVDNGPMVSVCVCLCVGGGVGVTSEPNQHDALTTC